MTDHESRADQELDDLLAVARARFAARVDNKLTLSDGLADVRRRAARPAELALSDLAVTLDPESWLRWLEHERGGPSFRPGQARGSGEDAGQAEGRQRGAGGQ